MSAHFTFLQQSAEVPVPTLSPTLSSPVLLPTAILTFPFFIGVWVVNVFLPWDLWLIYLYQNGFLVKKHTMHLTLVIHLSTIALFTLTSVIIF